MRHRICLLPASFYLGFWSNLCMLFGCWGFQLSVPDRLQTNKIAVFYFAYLPVALPHFEKFLFRTEQSKRPQLISYQNIASFKLFIKSREWVLHMKTAPKGEYKGSFWNSIVKKVRTILGNRKLLWWKVEKSLKSKNVFRGN